METMSAQSADIHSLRQEVTSLRRELAAVRMRMSLNSLTFDFGLMLTAIFVVFFVAMKVG